MKLRDKIEKKITLGITVEDLLDQMILSIYDQLDEELPGIKESDIFENRDVIEYLLSKLENKESLIQEYLVDQNYLLRYPPEEDEDRLTQQLFKDLGLEVKRIVALVKK